MLEIELKKLNKEKMYCISKKLFEATSIDMNLKEKNEYNYEVINFVKEVFNPNEDISDKFKFKVLNKVKFFWGGIRTDNKYVDILSNIKIPKSIENKVYQAEIEDEITQLFLCGNLLKNTEDKSLIIDICQVYDDEEIVEELTKNKSLNHFIKNENELLRECIASNCFMNQEILETLSTDKNNQVRQAVSINDSTPTTVLESLSRDASKEVRYCVSRNKNTPITVLEALSLDNDKDVKKGVSLNENCPNKILQLLASYLNDDVSFSAIRN